MANNWAGTANGTIPQSKLASDGDGGWLEPHAAADFLAFAAAFKVHFGKALHVTSSYRPLGKSSDPATPSGSTQWGSWNYYMAHGTPVAAYPGTSNHGNGQAVDLGSGVDVFGSAEHQWAVANGPTYGWVWGEAPSEAWHFHHLALSNVYKKPASPASTTPTVGTAKNKDGSLRLALNGKYDVHTIARLQEVMGTGVDGKIDSVSPAIKAEQHFLNSVVGSGTIKTLTGKPKLAEDGIDGPNTHKVLRFWIWNKYGAKVFKGHKVTVADFQSVLDPNTVKVLQYALNNATSGSKKF